MFIDYLNADSPNDIETDICIIGGGPAGITLALELATSGKTIAIIESGGKTAEADTQALSQGESTGQPYYPLHATRLRGLGGSTGHWSGWCGPLNELDFTKRSWIPDSGWSITLDDLIDPYEKAQEYCQLGPFAYQAEDWTQDYTNFPSFNADNLVARIWQFSSPPLNFGKAYEQALNLLPNVTVYTHANVTNLNLDLQGSSIVSANLQTLDGKAGTITAKQFVLACGGIENPRLMLASNDVIENGIGNDHDQVGRYFMEHAEAESATLKGFDENQMRKLKRLETQSGLEIGVAFCASEKKQRELEIGNGAAFIAAPRLVKNSGWTAFLAYRDALLQASLPKDSIENLKRLIVDFDSAAAVFAHRASGGDTNTKILANGSIDIISMAEQIPNPDSRVTLSDQKDQFGNPQANLHWQLTDLDKRTIKYTMQLIATEVSRLDLGRVQIAGWLQDDSEIDWSPRVRGGHHHMGTTRMSELPQTGVVDSNCKVHGIDNLFIAGSSVFPTGGYVNPTLTIVALSVRLAEHLKKHTI